MTDSDEAFYAESAREMIELSDWLTPHFNYEFRFEKPVLYYWLAAVSYLVLGESEWAARLPSALAGFGLVLLAYFIGRQWYDSRTAFLSGVITATSFGAVAMAHQALPDLPLAFFVTAAVWTCFNARWSRVHSNDEAIAVQRWLGIGAVSTGLAFLTKGPVAIVLLLIILVSSWLVEFKYFGKTNWPALHYLAVFCFIFGLTTVPWFWAMFYEHGFAYLERFFFAENVERFATTRYNSPRSVFYYLPILVGGLFPWSPFATLWIPKLIQGLRDKTVRLATSRLLIWCLAPLLFYTASIGKQPRYILPMLVPLSILLAHAMVVDLSQNTRPSRLFQNCAIVSAVFTFLLAGLLYRTDPLLFEWGRTAGMTVSVVVALSGVATVLSCVMTHTRRSPDRWARSIPICVAVTSIVVAVCAHTVLLASPKLSPVEKMANLIKQEQKQGEAYGRHRVFNRNLVYYVESPHVELPIMQAVKDFLGSSTRVLCVLFEEDVELLQGQGVQLYELGSVTYLNTGSLTLRVLLNPDPTRFVKRVVLVTNQRLADELL